MKVRIDAERCQGHNRCIATAPDIFHCDDLGYGVVTPEGSLTPEQEQLARRAVANCPESAIELVEDEWVDVDRGSAMNEGVRR